jgi:hypothetical protein
VSEDKLWQSLLRDALAVLALPPDEQVRASGPGCVACDLLNDFDNARTVALANVPKLSEHQRGLLERIDANMQAMEQPDFECFDTEVVRRPVWQIIRELAAEALREFGWESIVVRPFVEVQPGVWHGPPSEV